MCVQNCWSTVTDTDARIREFRTNATELAHKIEVAAQVQLISSLETDILELMTDLDASEPVCLSVRPSLWLAADPARLSLYICL